MKMSLLYLYVVMRLGCTCSRYTIVPMPMALFWTTNGGATTELQHMSRAASILRILELSATWIWIYTDMGSDLLLKDHLQSGSGLGLFAIGFAGTVLHILCFVQ